MAELECALVAKRPGALRPAASVSLPAVRKLRKHRLTGQTMHHPKLRNVQAVIKRAGDHRQPRSRLLVK